MKRLLMILPLLLVVGQAAAIERHDMSKMTCEEVKAALQSEHSAILRSPSSRVPGMMRSDKYVSDRLSCGAPPNWPMDTKIKTRDGSCVVYRCSQRTRNGPLT